MDTLDHVVRCRVDGDHVRSTARERTGVVSQTLVVSGRVGEGGLRTRGRGGGCASYAIVVMGASYAIVVMGASYAIVVMDASYAIVVMGRMSGVWSGWQRGSAVVSAEERW